MPLTKNASQISPSFLEDLKVWVQASRPKTLIAGISPVIVGGCLALQKQGTTSPLWFGLCLLFSLVIQIAANWANDYFDFVKGADTAARKGPTRAVQAGWIAPLQMRNAAFGAFLCAFLIALPLLARIGFVFLPLALSAIASGILYTGGKKPLGYLGLGELLVFIFYGPVAVCGTFLTLTGSLSIEALTTSAIPGLLSCAILCANNLRDASEDRKAKKMTLVARFGDRFGQIEYLLCLVLAALLSWKLAPIVLLFSIKPLQIVFQKKDEIGRVLPLTARLLAIYTVAFTCETLFL